MGNLLYHWNVHSMGVNLQAGSYTISFSGDNPPHGYDVLLDNVWLAIQKASATTIQAFPQSGGAIFLSWDALPGQIYQVQYTTSLNQPNWLPLRSQILATSNSVTVADFPTNSQRYYRIVSVAQ